MTTPTGGETQPTRPTTPWGSERSTARLNRGRDSRPLRRAITGTGAIFIIAVILIGIPTLLITLVGNPLPTANEVAAAIRLNPDWGNRTLLSVVLPCVTWIAWALFAIPLLAELLTRLTGLPLRSTRAVFHTPSHLATTLVAAALFTLAAPTIASSPASAHPVSTATDDRAAPLPSGTVSPENLDVGTATGIDTASSVIRDTRYRVKSGDTLWSLADRYLGAGRKYPEIADASTDIAQPGGQHLTDPDRILPGWQLDIPTPQHADAPPAQREPAPSKQPQPTPRTTPSASAPDSTSPAAPKSDTASPAANASSASDAAPAISGGVAAVLAASLLAALRLRRRRQRSARRPGERVALPAAAAKDLEQQLAAEQDPAAIEALHNALTHLQVWAQESGATLPKLFAVRADDEQIALFLAQPTELPTPFASSHGDHTAWAAPRTAFKAPEQPTIAPYPALVTIGTDQDGGLLLLDLEQLGVLTITGDNPTLTRAALNAIATELASVPWADDIHLSLVGLPADLPFELDPYRIHRVTDIGRLCRDLRTHLADRQQTLLESQLPDIRTARVLANDLEAWAPFVVLISTEPTQAETDELAQLVQEHSSTGLVVVHALPRPGPDSVIELHSPTTASYTSSHAGLPPLPFTPQLLEDTALAAVLELFATSNKPAATPVPEPVLDSRPIPTLPPEVTHDRSEREDPVAKGAREQGAAVTPSTDTHAPYIRILGPIDALNITATAQLPGRGIEFLTYLLTHQQPVPGAQIQKALWPNSYDRTNNNTRTLAKQVRSALGHDEYGHLWLPEGRGTSGFTLHPALRSDWHDLIALTRADPTTENLETALRLVRGQPLLGADAHRGRWAWRSPLEEEIIATILDTAEALAKRALLTGDLPLIRLASRTARTADPLNELSWQIELEAATHSADVQEIERIIADLIATAGAGNPDYEPDTTTTELITAAQRATRQSARV